MSHAVGKAIAISVGIIMIASALAIGGQQGEKEGESSLPPVSPNYIVHAPIRINSNAEFATKALSEGWPGDGTQGNPYIIENYDINGGGYGYCFYVGNTTLHFMLRNCYLHEASGVNTYPYYWDTGIIAYQIWNGTFVNNIVQSEYLLGIFFYTCNQTSLISNNVSYNDDYAIYLEYSTYCNITGNQVFENSCGIVAGYSSCYNIIASNLVKSNTDSGVYLAISANYNTIVNNDACYNGNFGINMWSGVDYNMIYHNRIYGNYFFNGYNTGTNYWDNGYPSGGNYWDDYYGSDNYHGLGQNQSGSDGIGDTPYLYIDGYGAQDNYPLMSPWTNQSNYSQIVLWIPVVIGWNLISAPFVQSTTVLPSALTDLDGDTLWNRAQWYDSTDSANRWKQYYNGWNASLNDLNGVNNTMGIWVNVTTLGDGYLRMSGSIANTTSIPLYTGWNLVDYPTLNNSMTVANALWGTGATMVETFDPAAPYRTKVVGPTYVMKPGEGYWIYVPADTVWVVDW